ncbi:hypothetical protein DID74_00825 [Candidatus Marinamargulisbacteria bacterium SCGC AG-333-B06]|nr:hypothetical protein DID74_00825 [Candidatus Marinamargulisbacteria bacterium SCGC AG-333-B06]
MSKINLSDYSLIILDCDGVIFDSNILKSKAMHHVTSTYDQLAANKFNVFFNAHFGKTRSFFIKSFITKFYKVPYTQVLYNEINNLYSKKCFELYKQAHFTDEVLSFLNQVSKTCQLYIASGSHQLELRKIFKYRNIDHFFSGIFGAPELKVNIIKNILSIEKKSSLFIGDSYHDFECAQENKINFLLLKKYAVTNKKILNKIELQCKYSYDTFKDLLNTHV